MEAIDYWNQFERTGSAYDYLIYRGIDTCGQSFENGSLMKLNQEQAGEDKGDGIGYRYGYGVVGSSSGRL